eukprot:m.76103 g.76103  ORF g.76103 m.76103 type:complete len:434 (-) comp14622_c0_seq1:74-1375(-)
MFAQRGARTGLRLLARSASARSSSTASSSSRWSWQRATVMLGTAATAAAATACVLDKFPHLLQLPAVDAAEAADVAYPPTKAIISHLMLPDDANPARNVHGGSILTLIDQAGYLAATKFVNQGPPRKDPFVCALARVQECDFLKAMHIGEVAEVEAEVVFTSPHSIEVLVNVYACNPLENSRRFTNQARLYYVCTTRSKLLSMRNMTDFEKLSAMSVPRMIYPSKEAEEAGQKRYAQRELDRHQFQLWGKSLPATTTPSAADSQQQQSSQQPQSTSSAQAESAVMAHLVLPSDCYETDIAQAGAIMKMMDSVAGIVAVRHCRSFVATACLEAMDFKAPIFNGNYVTFYARPIFNSQKSLEIQVDVYAEDITGRKTLTNQSRFVFVSFDKWGRTQAVPPFVPFTDEEKALYADGLKRYQARKSESKKKQQQEQK